MDTDHQARQEKATQQILDKIQYLEDKLDERLTHFQTVQMEHGMTLSKISNEVGLKEPKILAVKDATRSMPPKQTLDRLLKPSATDILLESESKSGDGMQPLDSNDPPGQSYVEREDGELSIPVEHTTAAHKLLSWPSIRNLLYPREYDEDYVMKLEEQRGLIRVYGRGEGDDTSEDRTSPTPLTSSNSSSGWDDSHAHRASQVALGRRAPILAASLRSFEIRGLTSLVLYGLIRTLSAAIIAVTWSTSTNFIPSSTRATWTKRLKCSSSSIAYQRLLDQRLQVTCPEVQKEKGHVILCKVQRVIFQLQLGLGQK